MKIIENSLTGKSALVTGAGSGIGQAAAVLLAEAGARVALVGRTAEELRDTCRRISEAKGTCEPLVADVSKAPTLQRAFDRVRRKWGRLDIVFANAGINGTWTDLESLKPEEWDETLGINLRGTFLTVKFAVPLMKKFGGSIMITSSVNGTRMFSNTGASAYATSKAGQLAFARMSALELARHGIRVNTICPGAVETNISQNTRKRGTENLRLPVQFPKGAVPLTGGRPANARQVAQLVWFLASDLSNHITGAEIFIDGGESLLEG